MKPPVLKRRLSGTDAAFLYLERREIPLHIAGVCIFEDEIPFDELVAALDSKLHLLPRYRQVVVDPPLYLGYPTWEDDPKFDIRRHIFHVRVEPPGGKAEFEALAGRILTQVMDRHKPLWDIHVVDGLEGGRGALIARVHHALADGVAGASLMKIMLDPTPEGSRAIRKPRFRPKPPVKVNHSVEDALVSAVHSSLENMIMAEAVLADFAQAMLDERTRDAWQKLATLLPELTASSERFPFNKPCSGERKFCWTEFSLADAQAIREKAGGTLNDVILTIVTRAVARYIKLHGEPVAGRFVRMVCPVNVRRDNKGESLGNQISFLPVALPLDIRDPVQMLHAVATRTEIMKNARAAHLIALMASWLGAAPPPLQAFFWRHPAAPAAGLAAQHDLHQRAGVTDASVCHREKDDRLLFPCADRLRVRRELRLQSYDGNLYCGLTAMRRWFRTPGSCAISFRLRSGSCAAQRGAKAPRPKSTPPAAVAAD